MFEATWRCEGKQPAGPMGPEQDYKSTFKGKKDVESFWISFEYSQKKSKAHAMPIIAKGYLGYDPAAKKYVSMGVDNMGGSVTESSPGWEADKLTFTGDGQMGGQKISFRETLHQEGRQGDDLVGRDEDGEGLDPRRHRHLQEVARVDRVDGAGLCPAESVAGGAGDRFISRGVARCRSHTPVPLATPGKAGLRSRLSTWRGVNRWRRRAFAARSRRLVPARRSSG